MLKYYRLKIMSKKEYVVNGFNFVNSNKENVQERQTSSRRNNFINRHSHLCEIKIF